MYTLFGYIISICLVLHLSFVTCFIAGDIKRTSHARSAIFSTDEEEEIVPTVDDVPNTSSEETNEFLKKSLVEFFSGVKQTKATHDYLARAQKRTIRSHYHKNGHRKTVRNGRRRHTVSRVRNDTDTTGTKDGKCKFPFIYDGKTIYQCLEGTSDKKWCSLTSNYDRDLLWTSCADDGSPVRRSKNIESLTEDVAIISGVNSDQFHHVEKKKVSNGTRKHETGKIKNKKSGKSVPEDVCDTCDHLPKNNTDTAVQTLREEIDDVDKSDKEIHSLVSKEVDNFIGSVLTKHGVPDTEQKELLALNAKLSTELAQEVSCKMSNESIGSSRSECVNKTEADDNSKRDSNITTTTIGKAESGSNLNKTSLNETGGSDELLSNEVDAFISSVLSQHNISALKQKEILKSIKKASTDIADQIDYVVSYAKAGGVSNKNNEMARVPAARQANNTPNSIHAAVDSFLSLVLEKHGVPTDEQKDILDWNAQLSTDIADQVNSIVEKAKKGKKSHTRHNEWKTQLKPNVSMDSGNTENNTSAYMKNHLDENKANSTANETAQAEQPSNEIQHLADTDTLQPIYEKGPPSTEHSDKDKPLHESDNGTNEETVIAKNDTNDASKKYDDVSPENDMETGIDDLGSSASNSSDKSSTEEASDDRGMAPEAVDTVAPNTDEAISPPTKLQYNVDDDDENMTSFANKEFNKKPQIHFKRKTTNHKKIMGDENWDKYLMDDGWVPRNEKTEEAIKTGENQPEDTNKEEKDNSSGEKELNDDEKTMINYVSDSIIQSVNNVKQPPKETEEQVFSSKGNDSKNDVTYKKLDSGKKPYLIYRVQQRKGDSLVNQPGIDSIDAKSQKIIPGAKNINIIIINNRNNSLDLNDIENTIARSSEPSAALNESNFNLANITRTLGNTSFVNKTSENLFLLINTTDTPNVTQMIRSMAQDDNNETDSKVELNTTSVINPVLLTNRSFSSDSNNTAHDTNTTDANNTVIDTKNIIDMYTPHLKTIKEENTNTSENTTASSGSILELDSVKYNETKQNDEPPSVDENKNISFSKILTEYDKDLETSTIQSLRKSGLISMNYAPEEIEVRTFGGNANGDKCMFPFIYDGDTYFNCININRDKPWCSITANYDKLPVWGFCDNEHPVIQHMRKNNNPTVGEIQAHKQQMLHNQGEELISKHSGVKTYGGNSNGAPCVIPFVYDGQTHMKCIPRHDGTAWCAASHSYDIHPIWGNCCDNDVYKC